MFDRDFNSPVQNRAALDRTVPLWHSPGAPGLSLWKHRRGGRLATRFYRRSSMLALAGAVGVG